MPSETLKPKRLKEIDFRPEGYLSSGDSDYLDELIARLSQEGLSSGDLVYSGFDATDYLSGQPMPRHDYIFAMDEKGWREAVKFRAENPAQYAEGWKTPCIGIYDKSQLAQAYSYNFENAAETEGRIELSDITLGENLSDLPPGTPVEEAVVHKDYPNGSPTDALVGLVFLPRE